MSLEEKYLINQARIAEERAKALEIECEALRSEIVRIKSHAVLLTEIVMAIELTHGIISQPAEPTNQKGRGMSDQLHALERREIIIHTRMIRAAIYAARGLRCEPTDNMSRLNSLLMYDKNSGNLYWRVNKGRVKAGQKAGSIHSNGYIHLMVDRKRIYAHRAIWIMVYGYPAPEIIDHIDGEKNK